MNPMHVHPVSPPELVSLHVTDGNPPTSLLD